MLDDARRYADAGLSSEPVWPWVFQVDAAKIASYRAITTARLALPKIGQEAFEVADGSARSPKQAAIVAVEHARAVAADGQPDLACELAAAAHEVGCSYDSERVRHSVREFRSFLGSRVPQRITADLDDRLHGAYADPDH